MGANMGTTVTNTLVAMTSMNRRTEFQRAFAGATMHDFFNLMTIAILFPLEQATHYLERSATWLSGHLVGSAGTEFPNPVKTVVKPAVSAAKHLLTDILGLGTTPATVLMVVLALAGIFFALTFLTKLLKNLVLNRAEGAFTKNVRKSGLARHGHGPGGHGRGAEQLHHHQPAGAADRRRHRAPGGGLRRHPGRQRRHHGDRAAGLADRHRRRR